MKGILAIISITIITNIARADLTAYEGFDYNVNESLTGLDGGIGWSSAWTTNGGLGGIVVKGLTYSDVNGNQLVRSGGAYAVNSAQHFYQTIRDTDLTFGTAETSVWLSFIIQQASISTGTNYATGTIGTGYSFGSNAMIAGIGGPTAYPFINSFYASSGGIADTSLTMLSGESAFLVLRFDFSTSGNDTLNLWYNPTLDNLPGEPLLMLSSKNYASVISGLTLAHGDNRSFIYDEIRIGTDFASVAPIREDSMFSNGFENIFSIRSM
jgi:hypothetical protein